MEYDISIGQYKIAYLLSCEVRKSANKIADTATIKLNGMAYNKSINIESKIKRGDRVSIKLGYTNNLMKEFEGYVTSVTTDNSITIECEDSIFLTKKEVESKQYKNVKVSEVIKSVINQINGLTVNIGAGVDDVRYDKFTVANATAFDVLKKIKEETGLHIFTKGKEINVFLKYTYKEGSVTYDFSKNVESSSLKYVKESDKKVLIEVIGLSKKNEKTKVEVGESGGDKITVHRYNVTDKGALKKIGEEEIKKYRYTGYDGSITGWLLPYCTYGYSCKIIDTDYPERQSTYYCEAVTTSFNQSGGKRKITLGIEL